jgi:hypothetical protein
MKKVGFLALAIVTVLATLGIGFSMWSQTVTVNGSVTTGNVLFGIRDGGGNDQAPDGVTPPGQIFPTSSAQGYVDPRVPPFTVIPNWNQNAIPFITGDKNVASATSVNGPFLFHGTLYNGDNIHDYYSSITETVTNAYPFYAPTMYWIVSSNSSVPVKINTFVVNDPNNILGTVVFYWQVFETLSPGQTPYIYGHGALSDLATALGHTQMEIGQQIYMLITMVFQESTPQSTSGSFTVSINAAQWNEVS